MGSTVEDYCGTCGHVIHGTHDPHKAYTAFCYGHPEDRADKQEEARTPGESMSTAMEAVRRMVEQIEGSETCKATVTHVEITARHIPLERSAVYDISIAWVEG